jgi:methylmalonyl-CoA mutase N-terminal domain/subunit
MRKGDGHRCVCTQPEFLLLQRHGPRVHGDRAGCAAYLGASHARALWRGCTVANAEVPHPDIRPQPASGRSLHAQEISFNDIRTTLQALYALFDNCNSLHTNAFDEAITTPTEQSVRRAVAIQMIISRELGLNYCENPWQGSFIINELTDLVEEAVYQEFERISERGGSAQQDPGRKSLLRK